MYKKSLSIFFLLFALVLNAPCVGAKPAVAAQTKPVSFATVSSVEIVNKPKVYLNKYVKITAIFNKFSTIGLDYKPAMRSSKDYISFLIKRDNVKDHVVPLSELKIFIKRDKAEKLVDLESGDKIEIKGKVFSNALGDAWMDAFEVKNLTPKPAKK